MILLQKIGVYGIMRYFIDNKIGEPGGFGDVYDCHSELGDRYAIKMLKTDDENAVLRFQKEVRLTSRLNHPNVIRIIAYDTMGEKKYYIMPKYQCSIVQIIPVLYNNFDRQYNVITEILNGLIYLHEQGVLHRDLKPQNILYNSDTDIAISDLGFSRQIDSDSLRLTQYGDVFGTQRYISPEQAQNSENVDDKTDIFAFGKILEDIVTNFLQYPIPNDEIGYIVDKCTNPHANRRFASSRELKSMVDNVYQSILKITANDDISTSISLLEMGMMDFSDIENLALKLMSHAQEDSIEKFFFALSDDDYKQLEYKQLELLQNLVRQLKDYYTSQMWGFNYTDTIGSVCQRFYNLTNDSSIRALFLFIILEVGVSHNRFYVMGIGETLIRNVKNNLTEAMELYSLLKQQPVYLSRLDITKRDLPEILQPYCN